MNSESLDKYARICVFPVLTTLFQLYLVPPVIQNILWLGKCNVTRSPDLGC